MTSDNAQLTRAEVAVLLGVTERTVDRYAERGLLTRRRNPITRAVAFDRAEVEDLARVRRGVQ